MDFIVGLIRRSRLLEREFEFAVLRGVMVIIFAWFGYDKWFEAVIRGLVPLITHGPLIFWTIPVLGVRGTSYFLGTSEWTFGSLLLLGFWSARLGMLGALGATFTFIATFTILPFAPGAWDETAGGFPVLATTGGFLLKDLVLLAVSVCLLKRDAARVFEAPSVIRASEKTYGLRGTA